MSNPGVNTEDLAQEETQLRKLGGDKIPVVGTATLSTPFTHAPTAGKRLVVFWSHLSFDPIAANAAGAFPQIKAFLQTDANPSGDGEEWYRNRTGIAHWEYIAGKVDGVLKVTTSNVDVDVTLHVKEIDP